MKILPWEAEFSMRTKGQTDMTKLLVVFGSFAKASKNSLRYGNKVEGRTKIAKEYVSFLLYVLGSPISKSRH